MSVTSLDPERYASIARAVAALDPLPFLECSEAVPTRRSEESTDLLLAPFTQFLQRSGLAECSDAYVVVEYDEVKQQFRLKRIAGKRGGAPFVTVPVASVEPRNAVLGALLLGCTAADSSKRLFHAPFYRPRAVVPTTNSHSTGARLRILCLYDEMFSESKLQTLLSVASAGRLTACVVLTKYPVVLLAPEKIEEARSKKIFFANAQPVRLRINAANLPFVFSPMSYAAIEHGLGAGGLATLAQLIETQGTLLPGFYVSGVASGLDPTRVCYFDLERGVDKCLFFYGGGKSGPAEHSTSSVRIFSLSEAAILEIEPAGDDYSQASVSVNPL